MTPDLTQLLARVSDLEAENANLRALADLRKKNQMLAEEIHQERVKDLERRLKAKTQELEYFGRFAQRLELEQPERDFIRAAIAYAEAKQTIEPEASEYKQTLAALREGN